MQRYSQQNAPFERGNFHKEMVSLILKDKHTVKTKNRDAKGEMMIMMESYAANDGLRSQESQIWQQDLFQGGSTPGRRWA